MWRPAKKVFLVLGILAIIFAFFSWSNTWRYGLETAVSSGQKFFFKIGLRWQAIINSQQLREENQRLREQLAGQSLDYIKLQSLQAENADLKRELNFINTKKMAFTLAQVVGRQSHNPNLVIIDQGQEAGLVVGQPATAFGGILVGLVAEVSTSRSLVRLLTDPDSQVPATLASVNGTNGLLRGQTGNALLLDLIPLNIEVNNKDEVVTSGLAEKIPAGLLIGIVSQVDNKVGEVFKQARVQMPFGYDSLSTLTIIKRTHE